MIHIILLLAHVVTVYLSSNRMPGAVPWLILHRFISTYCRRSTYVRIGPPTGLSQTESQIYSDRHDRSDQSWVSRSNRRVHGFPSKLARLTRIGSFKYRRSRSSRAWPDHSTSLPRCFTSIPGQGTSKNNYEELSTKDGDERHRGPNCLVSARSFGEDV